jgi:5-methyltetrahydrofolate--homocysteine methyltransferase
MANLQDIAENVICGRADKNAAYPPSKKGQPGVTELVEQAIKQGVLPIEILNEGLIAGMEVVGKRFKANECYVPEVLIAARAMKAGMAVLKPLLADTGVKPVGTMVIGTVKGDLHDIGKNLVGMMLEGAGFNIVDLGIDVGGQKFLEAIKQNPGAIIGMSALLTTTMVEMKSTIDLIHSANLDFRVPVVIGGAPVTQEYANEIGADGYAPDAASAVDLAKGLLKAH